MGGSVGGMTENKIVKLLSMSEGLWIHHRTLGSLPGGRWGKLYSIRSQWLLMWQPNMYFVKRMLY